MGDKEHKENEGHENHKGGKHHMNPFDLDGNGCVDGADLDVVIAAFGTQVGDPAYNEACDFNHDGLVNSADFNLFRRHVGEGCVALDTEPEAV